jgi:hypothetical protein
MGFTMQHNGVDYGLSEDRTAPHMWRYTIYPKLLPGGDPKSVSSIGYRSYREAETACKKEIDLGLSGANVAKRT